MEGIEGIDFLQKDHPYWKNTEEIFSKAYDEDDKETQYKCVLRICYGIIKSRLLKSRPFPDEYVFEKAMDAANIIIERYRRKNVKPKSLTGYCSFPIMGVLYDRQTQFEEQVELFSDNDNKEIGEYYEKVQE